MTPNDVVTRAIDAVCSGDHLTADHAAAVLAEIMEGRAGEVQTGAFLVALRAKGETVPELVGLARTMRSLATPVETGRTISSTRPAPAEGRRPSTSRPPRRSSPPPPAAPSPSTATARPPAARVADLLEALGVHIDLDPAQVAACIDEMIGFMFAPAPRRDGRVPVRGARGAHDLCDFLGPLTNPAGAERQLLGVCDREYPRDDRGARQPRCGRAMIVSAEDGVDELAISRARG